MSLTVISFATRGTPYVGEMMRLLHSLDKFQIPFCVQTIEPRGRWVENCAAKPEFIYRKMHEIGEVLWVDSDAEFRASPAELQRIKEDVAYYSKPGGARSGTFYARPTDAAKRFVWEWMKRANADPNTYDQQWLNGADLRALCSVHDLSVEYCCIFDLDASRCKHPIIVHHQASRRFKKLVGR